MKARKDAEQEAASAQTTLDGHLRPIDPPAPILKYSDVLFKEAAEDWMISTNQVRCLSFFVYRPASQHRLP